MADDGAGVYAKLAGSVAVTATTIASNPYNLQNDDYVAALNARLNINGIKPMTGPLAMGANKITGLAVGAAATDAANVSQIQSGITGHSTSVGGTVDAITVAHAPVYIAYTTNMRGIFTATGANTSTTPTVNIDSLGVKTLVKWNNIALAPGDIIGAGHEIEWTYNGTNVVILNPGVILNSKGSAVASSGTTNIWATYDDFVHITGTTTITSFGTAPRAGAERTVIFDGALTLTHNATSLILPGAANITTAAGDRAIVRADTTANMIVVSYTKADGTAVVATTGSYTQIGTITTTGAATAALTSGTWTGYRKIVIELDALACSTGGIVATIHISNNAGGTWSTTGVNWGTGTPGQLNRGFIEISNAQSAIANAVSGFGSLSVNGANVTVANGQSSIAGPVVGVRISLSTGTVTTVSARVFGVK